LNTMLSRLGRLPEDALLEVIHRLVEVRGTHMLKCAMFCSHTSSGFRLRIVALLRLRMHYCKTYTGW
jgi:hypothetical protein